MSKGGAMTRRSASAERTVLVRAWYSVRITGRANLAKIMHPFFWRRRVKILADSGNGAKLGRASIRVGEWNRAFANSAKVCIPFSGAWAGASSKDTSMRKGADSARCVR